MRPLANNDQSRRQSPRARSPVIDGKPRKSLSGSSRNTNESQITGAYHADGKIIGITTPATPTTIKIYFAEREMRTLRPGSELLKIVRRKTSAVRNSNGKIGAKAQS